MNVITVSQPWANILMDDKWIENRSWRLRKTGPLAIHAGNGTQYLTRAQMLEMPHSVIVGWAETTACYPIDVIKRKADEDPEGLIADTQRRWKDAAESPYCEGRFCIILGPRHKLIDFVPATGKQGIWKHDGIELLPSVKIDSNLEYQAT